MISGKGGFNSSADGWSMRKNCSLKGHAMQRTKIKPVLQHLTQHILVLLRKPCRMIDAGPEPAQARVFKALGNPRACEAGERGGRASGSDTLSCFTANARGGFGAGGEYAASTAARKSSDSSSGSAPSSATRGSTVTAGQVTKVLQMLCVGSALTLSIVK